MNTRTLLVSVLMLVSVLLTACAPAATPPSPTSAPPTAVATSAQTTVSPNLFKIPISITFGPDWRYGSSSPETIELLYSASKLFIDFLIVDHAALLESSDPPKMVSFPEDFAGYLQSNDIWSEITPAIPVSIGGANGYQIDAIGKSSASSSTGFLSFENIAFKEFIGTTPQKFRFFFFDNVSGNRLLIVIGDDDLPPLSPAEFDAILPEVQEVLDTVTLGG
jgi:hypothetical protein